MNCPVAQSGCGVFVCLTSRDQAENGPRAWVAVKPPPGGRVGGCSAYLLVITQSDTTISTGLIPEETGLSRQFSDGINGARCETSHE